jgi:predicted ester cyclase
MTNPRQVIDRHVAAFGAKDADAEPWSSDAELVTPVGQFQGREQVLGFLKAYWDAFPDARLEIVRSIEDGPLTAAEGKMIGTHSGILRTPEGDVPPTGRAVEIRWMGMYEVRGEELAAEHLYFDQAEFMTQLGVMSGPPAEGAATQA